MKKTLARFDHSHYYEVRKARKSLGLPVNEQKVSNKGEQTMKTSDAVLLMIATFLIGFMCSAVLCCKSTAELWKDEAIKHNAASYILVDKHTGVTKFTWNDESPEVKK